MGRRTTAFAGVTAVALAGLLLLGGLAPTFSRTNPAGSAHLIDFSATAPAGPIHAYVTWDGTNVTTATSDSAALSVNFASTITLRYYWSSSSVYNLSDARLQMYYFGFALSTRDVVNSNPIAGTSGVFTMTWQAGALDYLLEGTYRLTASLLTPSGSSAWSQDFYIHASAPADILAAIPIILLLIVLYEVYGLITSGRQSAPPTPAKATPPPAKPSTPPKTEDESAPKEGADS